MKTIKQINTINNTLSLYKINENEFMIKCNDRERFFKKDLDDNDKAQRLFLTLEGHLLDYDCICRTGQSKYTLPYNYIPGTMSHCVNPQDKKIELSNIFFKFFGERLK